MVLLVILQLLVLLYISNIYPSSNGACTIDVAADTFTDALGNNNTAASQFN